MEEFKNKHEKIRRDMLIVLNDYLGTVYPLDLLVKSVPTKIQDLIVADEELAMKTVLYVFTRLKKEGGCGLCPEASAFLFKVKAHANRDWFVQFVKNKLYPSDISVQELLLQDNNLRNETFPNIFKYVKIRPHDKIKKLEFDFIPEDYLYFFTPEERSTYFNKIANVIPNDYPIEQIIDFLKFKFTDREVLRTFAYYISYYRKEKKNLKEALLKLYMR